MATATLPIEGQDISVSNQPEFTINRNDLLAELQVVQHAIERRTTVPILGYFRIQASGDSLTIIGTDLDRTISAINSHAKVKSAGVACIPARKLFDYVKLLPDGEVTIKVQENHFAQIRSGRSHTKMVGLPAVSFPLVPAPPVDDIQIPREMLGSAIRRVRVAASEDDANRYALNGALMQLGPGKLTMVATDGHRLAINTQSPDLRAESDQKVLIPLRALDELVVLIDSADCESVDFSQDDSHLYFGVGSRLLSSRKHAGNFPNYSAVIPNIEAPGVQLDVALTLGALRRAMTFADERSSAVKLTISADTLSLYSKSQDIGETDEQLEIYGGPEAPLSIGYNGAYLKDVLTLLEGDVCFQWKDAVAGSLFTKAFDDGSLFKYVLMPMRVE